MKRLVCFLGLAISTCFQSPLLATISFHSMTPSVASPQPVGTVVTWTVTAANSAPHSLVFQFSVAYASGSFLIVRDFNSGTNNSGIWTAQPFRWASIQREGLYKIRVVAKDITTNETQTQYAQYVLTSLVTGNGAVVNATAHPLVALYSAPPCAVGSLMRVQFRQSTSTGAAATTDWRTCTGNTSMNFYIAGMYPNSTYSMRYEIEKGGTVSGGPGFVNFTTGALPSNITFPAFNVVQPAGSATDTAESVELHALISSLGTRFVQVATDLTGQIIWYYSTPDTTGTSLLTRPLANETLLTIQAGQAWQSIIDNQLVRLIDLAGNTVQETNTGIIQQQLLAMGFTDAQPCNRITNPQVGSACLGGFHHEAQRMPTGDYLIFADIEKIFPVGTQNDTSGLPVDILGDIFIVLDGNFQVKWAWDSFTSGGSTALNINRAAVLGETCVSGGAGCPPLFLLGPNISPTAHDWLHSNSGYYWPQNQSIIISIRHQDWAIDIDYGNGSGTSNILWRMGNDSTDFTFNNIYQDPWPWFSHQHDVGIENNGAGPMTIFDDGNTRVSPQPLGLGCTTGTPGCNSRGMALTIDLNNMSVTPALSTDLGVYSFALGSAQLLSNGDYFFLPGIVNFTTSYCIEVTPVPNTPNGNINDNLSGPTSYRSFRQPDMYHPDIT